MPEQHLSVVKRGDKASFRGLITCGRWDCPVCGPKAAEREAATIGLAVSEQYARGGGVALVTLTLRHKRSQSLLSLLDGLGKAWISSRTGRGQRALWSSLTDGFIRKLEITYGSHGWHPHLHLLVFLKPGVTDVQANELVGSVFAAWAGRLERLGIGRPSKARGYDIQVLDLNAAHEAVSAYVAKDAGRELAAAGTKHGRQGSQSVGDLLDAATAGDPVAHWRYLEYEEAMRGRHRVEWSHGLKDELVDDELVGDTDDQEQGRPIAVFTFAGFARLRENQTTGAGPGFPMVLRQVELHDDDDHAFRALHHWCIEFGIPPPTRPSLKRATHPPT